MEFEYQEVKIEFEEYGELKVEFEEYGDGKIKIGNSGKAKEQVEEFGGKLGNYRFGAGGRSFFMSCLIITMCLLEFCVVIRNMSSQIRNLPRGKHSLTFTSPCFCDKC